MYFYFLYVVKFPCNLCIPWAEKIKLNSRVILYGPWAEKNKHKNLLLKSLLNLNIECIFIFFM